MARANVSSWTASLASILAELWSRALRERKNRWAIAELLALDDRMLKDIGLSRGEIDHAARHGRPWS
jgi:uncharacterized protein YjiS (DUF1127 family)